MILLGIDNGKSSLSFQVDIVWRLEVAITWESNYGKMLMQFMNGEIGSHHNYSDGQLTGVGNMKEDSLL
jgi:hypothetical protein